jgi:phospholipid/cholesterol/gamma-HCH transport system substrate-binding protein
MPRSLRWSQLLPGLVALAAMVGVVLVILLFAQVGAARGETVRVYTAVASARGIMRGSEVWLQGLPVGVVRDVNFLPPSAPPERRLLLSLDVGERFQPFIRRDADTQVRAGGSIIGAPVIYITGGTPTARAVARGDTLISRASADVDAMTAGFTVASRELPLIMQNVRVIGTQLRAASGTIGAFRVEEGGVELGGLQARGARIAARLRNGQGTLGLALGAREGLAMRARSAMARADSIRALLASGRGELGRFRRDSTLLREVGEVRDELTIVRALLDESRGTAGRALHDGALRTELARTDSAMTRLFADIKSRPLRYLNLF